MGTVTGTEALLGVIPGGRTIRAQGGREGGMEEGQMVTLMFQRKNMAEPRWHKHR